MQLLHAKWAEDKFVCVGPDTNYVKIPAHLRDNMGKMEAIFQFNKQIIDTTKDIVAAYKPNYAFYFKQGLQGLEALYKTVAYINEVAPDVPVIIDMKIGDIGDTNEQYAGGLFDEMVADAVTVHNYMGHEAMKPLLQRIDKGIIVLCRTSNAGANEFQFGRYNNEALSGSQGKRFYMAVAEAVDFSWNYNKNCMLVCGATYPDEIEMVRKITQLPLLIPGIGKQGGDLENSVKNAIDNNGQGFLINSSSGIIFASGDEDFAERAREETLKLHEAINKCRNEVLAVK